jgi:endo-1,4-beta-xylanase
MEMRAFYWKSLLLLLAVSVAPSCSGENDHGDRKSGTGSGGTAPMEGTGGLATGGTSSGGKGGVATVGLSTGGVATGGVATGGLSTGGVATGGVATGGVATGGTSASGKGGAATGGVATGGTSAGGKGGAATGGIATGGTSAGGMPSACTDADTTICRNGTGEHCGYTYEFWEEQGTGCQVNTPDGFTAEWSEAVLIARKGSRPGSKNQVVTYSANFKPGGNSYLSVYGWFKDPIVEYYIVESWGDYRPPNVSSLGSFSTDGGTYEIYSVQHTTGIDPYKTYYSVRTSKRTSGTVTIANHFEAWESRGLTLGTLYDVTMAVEAYQSSGSAEVIVSMLPKL